MILGTCWAGVLPLPFCQAFPSQALHLDAHLPPAQLPTRVYSTYHSPRHGILFELSATSPSTSPMAFYHFAFLGLLRNLASSQNLQSIALHPRPLFNIHQILWPHRLRQSLLSLHPHSSHLATPGRDKYAFSDVLASDGTASEDSKRERGRGRRSVQQCPSLRWRRSRQPGPSASKHPLHAESPELIKTKLNHVVVSPSFLSQHMST